MICLNDANQLFLHSYPTDMCKRFYSLSGIVTNEMGINVLKSDTFVFLNCNLTNIKLERGAVKLPRIDEDNQSIDSSGSSIVRLGDDGTGF